MAPKKGKKMDLGAFLADESTGGSWADEMDALPTGRGYGRSDRDDFRPQRAEVPFPTAPPYTAFVGNLSFETVDDDLRDFFAGAEVRKVLSVRMVSGADGKSKGFGYVEFSKSDDLRNSLGLSGSDLNGRSVRISVAEAPREGGRPEGRADAESTWTRSGPLAPLAGGGRSGGFSGGSRFGAGGPGGGYEAAPDVEREGPIRGGKFQPSAPSDFGGARRTSGFGGGDRSPSGGSAGVFERREFQAAPLADVEREGLIRGGKFVATLERASSGAERRGPSTGRADEERTWTRGAPLPPAPQRSGSGAFRRGLGDRTRGGERPRLQLSARSSAEGSSAASPAPSSRPSPFGAAKPVETREPVNSSKEGDKPKLTSTSARSVSSSSSFGAAKPIDVSVKEREAEHRISKARLAATPATTSASSTVANQPKVAPPSAEYGDVQLTTAPASPAALKKDGISYTSAAATVDEVADGVEQTSIE
ncbi:BQ2448_7612 [Microbotryum intermedium]|uniref:BQ2448_7612 protein n=1 Tax=Microbotryum intermedium TaxID=269621 RepID=A0A238FRI4_9BASI|nr:BQ2448_7612 [Microbotryum intermedium]